MLRKIFYSNIYVSLLFLSACHESPTIIDDTPVGRRDYTWKSDTLRDQPGDLIWPFDIWGSSHDNVWIVGHGDESDQCKWHFDGTKWQKDSIRLSSNLNSVFGFAQNDVWICEGPVGRIFHYDGSKWTRQTSGTSHWLRKIWGIDAQNIFAVGDHATILYYDGKTWKTQKTGTNYSFSGIWGNRRDDVYVVGVNPAGLYDHLPR